MPPALRPHPIIYPTSLPAPSLGSGANVANPSVLEKLIWTPRGQTIERGEAKCPRGREGYHTRPEASGPAKGKSLVSLQKMLIRLLLRYAFNTCW